MKRAHYLHLAGLAICLILLTACDTEAADEPRPTAFPSGEKPDLLCLTWSGDPCTTQTIQWRTAPTVESGIVQYKSKVQSDASLKEVQAAAVLIEDALVTNDPVNRHYTATLKDLTPGTTYLYRVGVPGKESWTDWAEFATAPSSAVPFSFVYMGDPQVGLDSWGRLLAKCRETDPDAAFYAIAGDNVNRGNNRDEWDNYFQYAQGSCNMRPFVPCIGNHDTPHGDPPTLYLNLFALPENGPEGITPERAYSFRYGNALFIVLDPNLPAKDQREWLESELIKGADAKWKFALYHQPAYSSVVRRDDDEIQKNWCDLFDRYHLDMALQGHDHAYLRTPPLKAGKKVSSPAEGTIYVLSVSGTKYYDQDQREFTEVGFVKTSTFQTIAIQTAGGDTLTYRACDINGKVLDEVVIKK